MEKNVPENKAIAAIGEKLGISLKKIFKKANPKISAESTTSLTLLILFIGIFFSKIERIKTIRPLISDNSIKLKVKQPKYYMLFDVNIGR